MKSVCSYSSLIAALVLLTWVFMHPLQTQHKDIALTSAGFFLGLFGAYLFSVIESLSSFSLFWSKTIQSITSKDLLALDECLSSFKVKEKEFLPEVSLKYNTHLRILRFIDLVRKICHEVANGNWEEAARLSEDSDRLRQGGLAIEALNDIQEYKDLIYTHDCNANAINFYTNSNVESSTISAVECLSFSEACHEAINSPEISCINLIPRFKELLNYNIKLLQDEESELHSLLEIIISSTSILGIFDIVKDQRPIHVRTEDEKKIFMEAAEEFGIKIQDDSNIIDLGEFLGLMLKKQYCVSSLSSAIIEIQNSLRGLRSRIKYPYSFFLNNLLLFQDRPVAELIENENTIKEIASCASQSLDIMRLNITSIIIRRGLLPSEVETAKRIIESLYNVDKSKFYYDGIRLNKALISFISEKRSESLAELLELSENSNNYLVRSCAQKVMLGLAARAEDTETFVKIHGLNKSTGEKKGYIVETLSKDEAAQIPIQTPIWHFIMLSSKQQFAPYKTSPWGVEYL